MLRAIEFLGFVALACCTLVIVIWSAAAAWKVCMDALHNVLNDKENEQ
jgi:hypothetical protein